MLKHLAWVHSVDMVRTKYEHVAGSFIAYEVHVLEKGVGGACKPLWSESHLGGHGCYVVAENSRHPPRPRDVHVEAVALVLSENDDASEAAIHEVRECKVDQSVLAPMGYRGLCPDASEWHETLSCAASEDNR